ncbi:hypothetical protein [Paracidovorax valerianellae]|uniref:Uncharacterized protein n=1 Tax=Paracidovorax valerianellae TaxID=187868 RepID=A0A1G7F919_9BURK|nr:hypothetical protein [Paracidovorax valerianellae]MDA8443637.1 hypothetical protein [Paracidovorax valerianellae]SDE72015.1 hypothetical protein SAMN05192589_12724 [Paracidovorax valerianellae]
MTNAVPISGANFCHFCECELEAGQLGSCPLCAKTSKTGKARLFKAIWAADEVSVDYCELEQINLEGGDRTPSFMVTASARRIAVIDQEIELTFGEDSSFGFFMDMGGDRHFLVVSLIKREPLTPADIERMEHECGIAANAQLTPTL